MLGVALIATTSFAQPKKTEKAKAAVPAKKEVAAAKPAATKPAPAPAAAPKMKADGTPDKRFKENKATKPAAGPLKKDGTPDMRYKANKKG